jgi:hypothetical protein
VVVPPGFVPSGVAVAVQAYELSSWKQGVERKRLRDSSLLHSFLKASQMLSSVILTWSFGIDLVTWSPLTRSECGT